MKGKKYTQVQQVIDTLRHPRMTLKQYLSLLFSAVLYVCGNIIEIEVMLSRQPDFLVVEIVDHDGMAIL